jgi:tRNA 2-thiouridine synthesizing protein A
MSAEPVRSDGPESLAVRTARVRAFLDSASGVPCDLCGRAICGHEALMSYAAGRLDAPLCLACLAEDVARPAAALRDELAGFIVRKDCLSRGWAWANEAEGLSRLERPRCLWKDDSRPSPAPTSAPAPSPTTASAPSPSPSAHWDAGDMSCGDLVLELRTRLAALRSADVLRLTARDPAAPEDLPAWCRLTGNELVCARPPDYFIRRRN